VSDIKPIEWKATYLRVLDQRELPLREDYLELRTVNQVIDAIQSLAVRGAPALGAVGGYAVVVAMLESRANESEPAVIESEIDRIRDARPTAVNLAWAVSRVRKYVHDGIERVLQEAMLIEQEDREANRALSEHGVLWLESNYPRSRYRALTHCNTGTLATTYWGTALGVLRSLHEKSKIETVYADETRPLLQGSRLTAWELKQLGIAHRIQVDSAAASAIVGGMIDFAIIGADRIANNGDTANKVGSLAVALACKRAGIPFLVAAPTSTIDVSLATGALIEIEERADREVTHIFDTQVAPESTKVFNPAFDVTPSDLIAGIITERGVFEPGTGKTFSEFLAS
jgi:methylthioribose-1-phosphate isomerase